ncbi:MAG TPA: ABC transporter ATP-binding protein, partial [Geobacter anodireducens]|nr:ABC transporter ATP-binding protein [Geobacter anodireducens]
MRFSVDLKTYAYPDGTVALSDIRFQVARGEFCGILGSNGSGKTTLLKIMDGLIREYDGSVLLDGRDVRSLQPKDIYRTVGLVFQNPDDQLFAHTVFEDVAFGPRNMGFAEAEVKARVERALEAVDLAGAAAKQIHHLSYGQKKRACIAGLLAMGH